MKFLKFLFEELGVLWFIISVMAVAAVFLCLARDVHADTGVYQHFARTVAKDYKIDPSLFQAIGRIESDYRHDARGAAGEVGMFQVKPSTVLTVTGGVDPYAGVRRTYQFGSTGPEVAQIQGALNERGASLIVDGRWGANTERAVRDYQRAHGLVVDGVAGHNTLAVLGLSDLAGRSIRDALRDPFVNTIWAAEVLVWCRSYLGRAEHGVMLMCFNQGPGSQAVRYMRRVFEEMDRINGVKAWVGPR